MTPSAMAHLGRAHEALNEAKQIAAIKLPKVAARSAYFAAFHAAESLIAERTGKVAKTHIGVRAEFARLTREVDRAQRPLLAFLGQAYRFKEISDYAVGVESKITIQDADDAIGKADRFVTTLIDANPSTR